MTNKSLQALLDARFGDAPKIGDDVPLSDTILSMAGRGSCRNFLADAIPKPVLDLLCAAAFTSPSKSDLQQRDIVVLESADRRKCLAELVAGQAWIAHAPAILVICGNNRRQRLVHDWTGIPFANDHLDALFNAIGDAAIALGAFVTAAESVGLGCCPISGVRNEATAVSELLSLPDHVFPFAGLAVGYPAEARTISPRLPLKVTYHTDSYQEDDLKEAVRGYDTARATVQPYEAQRFADIFGTQQSYGWSDDKARQYSQPERADFGEYVRKKGFRLD